MNNYIPDRKDIVWIDFEPQKGKEIGKYRPALILSSKEYAVKTGLIICSPISTSIRGGIFEVPIDSLDKPSVIVSTMINTLAYKERKVKFITKCDNEIFNQVLYRLLPIIGAKDIVNDSNSFSNE
jgi:mRNA interferase MazF